MQRIAQALSLVVSIGAIALAGCADAWYSKAADTQVRQILTDRKQTALGYQPDTNVQTTVSIATSRPMYARIPFTPLPPAVPHPLERASELVPYEPLGPKMFPPVDPSAPRAEAPTTIVAKSDAAGRFVLGPPSPAQRPLHLDLYESIAYSVQHSRQYKDRIDQLYLAALDVTLQRHLLLEPSPFATQQLNFSGGERDVNYASALSAVTTVGVRQPLPYGGSVTAQALVGFVQALNDHAQNGETAQLALTGSVPLLRGAGMVNLEPLIESERSLVYNVRAFEDYRRTFAVNIASLYFSLRTSQQSINNRRIKYENLSGLTARTQALYDAGRITFLDVQRALQAELQAENDLINAQQTYETRLDQFKIALGMDVGQQMDIVPIELIVREPDIDNQDVIALAMKYRLDLQTARDQIDDARRGVAVASNELLPDLNLNASAQMGNEGATPASRVNNRTLTYNAGLTFALPLDRFAERNAYRQSLITLDAAQRGFVDTQQAIAAAVRDAVRAIHSAESSLQIQRLGIQLAERRVEYANELLIQGTASSRDVVEAQADLLSAEDSFELARATLQVQILTFLRATGTLRLDQDAGALGLAMDRQSPDPAPGVDAK